MPAAKIEVWTESGEAQRFEDTVLITADMEDGAATVELLERARVWGVGRGMVNDHGQWHKNVRIRLQMLGAKWRPRNAAVETEHRESA